MTDETINVVYDVTEKGMANVRNLVAGIRKELDQSGVDTAKFESRLEGIERTVSQVSTALKGMSGNAQAAGRAGAAAGKETSTAWQKVQQEIREANKEYRKYERGQVTGESGGKSLGSFSTADLERYSAARKAENADVVSDYEKSKRQQLSIDRDYARQEESVNKASATADRQRRDAELAAEQKKYAESARLRREEMRQEDEFNEKIERAQKQASRGSNTATNFRASQATGSNKTANARLSASWDAEYKAATASAAEFERQQNAIISQRYALYDVASTIGIIGTALSGAAIYAGVVGARFESAFTNVQRTLQTNATPAEVDAIRASLVRLSGQIPQTFDELAQIATIGNQMGIAKDDIIDFTGTISRFASVTGLSVETVTKAFGGFMAQTGLAPKYLENLGASIAKVGIDSNASEEQILSLMKEIAAGSKQAGFAADQIVGLSGTLAGLQVAPERARGALSTYFNTLNMAVAKGGEDLQNFATVVGVTSDELERMVRDGEGADVLRRFLGNLQDLDNVDTTRALDALNLAQLRVSDTFIRLSGSLGIYDRDQRNANQAFVAGAELQRQYAMTVDDLASQWTIFTNNLNGVIDAITGGAIPSIAALFGVVNNVLMAFTAWLGDNKWAAMLIAFGVAVAGAVGVMLLIRAASFTATASMLAFRLMARQAGADAIIASGGIRGLAGSLLGIRGAAGAATGGILTLRSAIRSLLAATGIGLLLTIGGSLIDRMTGAGTASGNAALSLQQYNEATKSAAAVSGAAADGADTLADSLGGGGGGGGGGVGDAAEETAKKVRTLVDYVSDLSGVFARSGDIRFGSQAALDDVTLKWIEMNEEIEEYQQKVRSLTADKELQQYFLGIANLYDDQTRAAQLRENIAKIDDDLADANRGASRELTGNSRAAIENRKTMRDLVGGYQDYIEALAASGASQEEIQAVIASLNNDFATQASQLGFNGAELGTYTARFEDFRKIVAAVPYDVTVAFNGDPALQALNEFFAKAEEQARQAGGAAGDGFGDGFGGGLGDALPTENPFEDTFVDWGSQSGYDWLAEFTDAILRGDWERASTIFTTNVTQWALNIFGPGGIESAAKFMSGLVNQLLLIIPGIGPLLSSLFTQYMTPEALRGGGNAGTAGANSFNTNFNNFVDPGGVLRDKAYGAQWGLSTAFANLGITAGNSFNSNFQTTLANGKSVYDFAAAGRAGVGLPGLSSGGYTGAGHWLQPAGIVHRGEYVIPKKYVNQSTGLPDAGYVASLNRGKTAAGPGYATGGFVGGGMGMTGPFELGPSTLHYLGQALQVRLGVDSRQLSTASSRGDRKLAWAGSN